LEQLKAAGIDKGSEDDSITEKDKTVLLEHLQKAHGNAEAGTRKKITLIKRENSEIRQADSAGRTRTVQVEVRKKRVLVKRGDEAAAPEEAPVAKSTKAAAPAKPIISEEELEKRAAEATRQAELLARQEAEMKAAEDARQKEAEASSSEKESKSSAEGSAAAEKKVQSDKAAKDLAATKEKRVSGDPSSSCCGRG
jgi:translation initiation factor IF-2